MRYTAFRRLPERPSIGPRKIRSKRFPAPTKGWVPNQNPAMGAPLTAALMDNWFPEMTGCRVRAGSTLHATIGDSVETLFSYRAGLQVFFAADEENIYDITTPADPEVPPVPDVSGQTSGYYSAVPFTTAGGSFLYALNGTDDPQLFDGSTWIPINGVSVPPITGVTSSDLSQGWVYRNRLFFVEAGTMNVWYPAVGALGGALDNITMQGIYRRGGAVLFGATWSLDSGDGIDDKAVIVSTEGEVAVFEGSNPSGTTAAEWNLVGVYDCAKPLGKNAWQRVGGDLLILTEEGVVPLTAIIQKDPAALALSAVSRPIEPEWRREALNRRALPWEMVKWTERNMGVVNVPAVSATDDPYCYVVNLESGAWARYTGWDTRCIHVFNENGYFGTNDGQIYLMESGGKDGDDPYECVLINHFDALGADGAYKSVQQIRASFIADRAFNPFLSASTDYEQQVTTSPSSIEEFTADVWDVGLWDVMLWDASGAQIPISKWDSVGRSGFSIAWQVQVTSATTLALMAELISVDLTYEVGDLVV